MIGYWQDSDEVGDYLHPQDLVDPTWEPELRQKIVDYLRSGERFRGSWGYSKCRFDDGRPDSEMGSMELTDGVYAWPEGLAVYVEHYNVILPQDFVAHMKAQDFKIPMSFQSEQMKVDLSYWKKWGIQYLASKKSG
jgi:hypothetical protein